MRSESAKKALKMAGRPSDEARATHKFGHVEVLCVGNCNKGNDCTFADEPKDRAKAVPCEIWEAGGTCPKGNRCWGLHKPKTPPVSKQAVEPKSAGAFPHRASRAVANGDLKLHQL